MVIPFSVEFEPIVIPSLRSRTGLSEAKDLTARDSSADLRMTEKAHFQVKMVLVAKFGYSANRATEVISNVLIFARLVTIENKLKVIALDPDDDKVLECAVSGKATHVVSGDHHLLSLTSFKGIAVASAVDFLALVLE